MSHWTEGALACYDTETTGTDVETDRIVSYHVGFQDEHGYRHQSAIVNCGVPIPETASQIHGITNGDAEFGVSPEAALLNIEACLYAAWGRGAPVIIFNAVYDLSLTDREMRRHLKRPLEIRGPIIDPLVIDRILDTYRKGSRRLADTCKHYGIELAEEDTHSASGDAKAALGLAVKLGQEMPASSLADLYRLQVDSYRIQRESFFSYLTRKGETPDDWNTTWPMKPYERTMND